MSFTMVNCIIAKRQCNLPPWQSYGPPWLPHSTLPFSCYTVQYFVIFILGNWWCFLHLCLIPGIRIHFLLLLCCMVFVPMSLPQSLAASLGESHCNQACYESVEHFCKQIFSSYVCMKCKGVCTNEDSQSDRDICHQNCQGQFIKLFSCTCLRNWVTYWL